MHGHLQFAATQPLLRCPALMQVVLKEFDLSGGGNDAASSVAALRMVQREVEHLLQLQHPCLIAPDLFFVEPCGGAVADDAPAATMGRGMLAYVQFPWYPTDMEHWLATGEAVADGGIAARVVALDVLRGLEHVHRHGIVHCDVKPASVLITERPSGPYSLRRGILSNLDRSMDVGSGCHLDSDLWLSVFSPPKRDIPEALAMAPELAACGTHTDKSDVYGFGGILLRIVCPAEANRWASAPVSDRWGIDGEPLLSLGSDAVDVELVTAMLQKSPAARPTCEEAVQDAFFLQGLVMLKQQVHELKAESRMRANQLSLDARRAAGEAEQAKKELDEVEKLLRRDIEIKEAEMDDTLEAVKLEREELESHAALERKRLAEDARQIQEMQEVNKRAEAQLGVHMASVYEQKEQIKVDRQSNMVKEQQLSAASEDLAVKFQEISMKEAASEAKRCRLERESYMLAWESLHASEKLQVLAKDNIRAYDVMQSMQCDMGRRLEQLESAKLRADADNQKNAAQARAIKVMQKNSVRFNLELETKKLAMEQERLALVNMENEVRSVRSRLQQDAQMMEEGLERLERDKSDLVNRERRFQAARRLHEQNVLETKAKADELDEKSNQLRLEEEHIKEQARATQVAIDRQWEELQFKSRQLQEQEQRIRPIPPYWSVRGVFECRLENDTNMVSPLQQLIRETSLDGSSFSLAKARVTRVMRIENKPLWLRYQNHKSHLRESLQRALARGAAVPTLESLGESILQPRIKHPVVEASIDTDELLLFHGTSDEAARNIAAHGFNERLASDTGIYGAGIYFADRPSKSQQYSSRHTTPSGEHVMLICRLVLGWPCLIQGRNTFNRDAPPNQATPGKSFDSIFAQTGVVPDGDHLHNEFIVFQSNQTYAEFLVYYKVR